MAEIRFFSRQRGSVLVMVLWVLALLTMIVAYYSSQVKIMRNAAQYMFATTRGKEAAMSVLRLVAKRLVQTPDEGATGQGGGEVEGDAAIYPNRLYSTTVGGLEVSFTVENEAGKIDINRASEGLLRDLFRYLLGEEDPKGADTVVDGILDWRDSDKLTRVNGAEDDLYMDKVPPYHAANGPFKTVEELRLVNGVTDRLFFGPLAGPNIPKGWTGGLLDLITIYNGTTSLNPAYAPAPLRAFVEDRAIEGNDRRSQVWLLKVSVGHRAYRLYFSPLSREPGFVLKFYSEGMAH